MVCYTCMCIIMLYSVLYVYVYYHAIWCVICVCVLSCYMVCYMCMCIIMLYGVLYGYVYYHAI